MIAEPNNDRRRSSDVQLDRIENKLDAIEETINGIDGNPGLKTDIAMLKAFQDRAEKMANRGLSFVIKLTAASLAGGGVVAALTKLLGE